MLYDELNSSSDDFLSGSDIELVSAMDIMDIYSSDSDSEFYNIKFFKDKRSKANLDILNENLSSGIKITDDASRSENEKRFDQMKQDFVAYTFNENMYNKNKDSNIRNIKHSAQSNAEKKLDGNTSSIKISEDKQFYYKLSNDDNAKKNLSVNERQNNWRNICKIENNHEKDAISTDTNRIKDCHVISVIKSINKQESKNNPCTKTNTLNIPLKQLFSKKMTEKNTRRSILESSSSYSSDGSECSNGMLLYDTQENHSFYDTESQEYISSTELKRETNKIHTKKNGNNTEKKYMLSQADDSQSYSYDYEEDYPDTSDLNFVVMTQEASSSQLAENKYVYKSDFNKNGLKNIIDRYKAFIDTEEEEDLKLSDVTD